MSLEDLNIANAKLIYKAMPSVVEVCLQTTVEEFLQVASSL